MKKLLSLVLVSVIILSVFTSCQSGAVSSSALISVGKTQGETTKESTESLITLEETSENTETEEPLETEEVDPETLLTPSQMLQLKEYMPKIDGSTSLIPFEKAVRAALYSKTVDEIEEQGEYYDSAKG